MNPGDNVYITLAVLAYHSYLQKYIHPFFVFIPLINLNLLFQTTAMSIKHGR